MEEALEAVLSSYQGKREELIPILQQVQSQRDAVIEVLRANYPHRRRFEPRFFQIAHCLRCVTFAVRVAGKGEVQGECEQTDEKSQAGKE